MSKELQMPRDTNAEIVLLGSIFVEEAVFPLVHSLVQPEHFHSFDHQRIFQAMIVLYEQERPIDPLTVQRQIEIQGDDDLNASTISSIINSIWSSGQALEAAQVVLDMALYRQGVTIAQKLAHLAYHKDPEMLAIITKDIHDLEQQSMRGTKNFYTMPEITAISFPEIVEQKENPNRPPKGIATGFSDLDRLLSFQDADLNIIAARPSVGKSTVMLAMARKMALAGHHVGIVSMEMSKEQLFTKLLAMGIPMSSHLIHHGLFDDEGWSKIVASVEEVNTLHISICDTSGISVQDLQLMVRTLHAQHPLDILFVDYMQMLQATINGKRIENEYQAVTEVSRQLKHLAKTLKKPIVALAQLSRSVESRASKIPQMSDLRQSGQIEQDASVIIMLYRDELYTPDTERRGITDLIVVKNRYGAIGEVSLSHDLASSSYTDLMAIPPSTDEGEDEHA